MRAVYAVGIRSPRLRAWIFKLPLFRIRSAVVARYFWQIVDDMGHERFDRFLPSVRHDAEVDLFGLGTYQGPDGWRDALKGFREVFPAPAYELREYVQTGPDQVVLVIWGAGPAAMTGIPFEERVGFVLRIKDGLAVYGRLYPNRAEALEAAGLSE
jgi:ketosteroid isomerase-like protein